MCHRSASPAATRRWLWLGLVVLVAVAALTLPAGLTPNARYEIGGQAVSMHGVTDTFTHRPLMHRWLMAVLVVPASWMSRDVASFEVVLRALAIVGCVGAAGLLGAGLARHRRDLAWPIATATAAAMLLVSPGITFEPDWLAVPVAVTGLGVALLVRRRWVAALVGGLLLAVAAAIKVITLPTALVALLALALLDRRRLLPTTAAALAWGLGWIAWVHWAVPREFQWMLDTAALQPARGPGWSLASAVELLGNAATLWPVVALIPMVFVGAGRRERWAIGAALVLAWLPVQVQNQFNLYHLAPLAVLGAICMVRTLQRGQGGAGPVAVLVAASTWTAWVLTTPVAWRESHRLLVFGVVAGLLVVGLVAQVHRVRRLQRVDRDGPSPHRRHWPFVAAGSVVLATIPASLPTAAWAVTMRDDSQNSVTGQRHLTALREDFAADLHARIGEDTPVTYLALGDRAYLIGNPTPCRYPTNVFLQRSRFIPEVERTASYRDNLRCLAEPESDFLVWDPDWFPLESAAPEIRDAVTEHYDCGRGFRSDSFVVCPRRGATSVP